MKSTIVLQSHRTPLPFLWLSRCVDSVSQWAEANNFDYRFIGDELFDDIDTELLEKTANQKVIATDLGRLQWLKKLLSEGYETVVWCDTDFLIFDPEKFVLPTAKELPERYALGREVWVQNDAKKIDKLKSYKKVHNAFLLFRSGNNFLDFYIENADRLLKKITGTMPPQFIGPKLLTAIHNVIQCPVMESAGMLSPLVVRDISVGGGAALQQFKRDSQTPVYAANLCSSLAGDDLLSDSVMNAAIDQLLKKEI